MRKLIEVQNLNYKYDNQENYALKNVSFSINQGEWVSIIGRNGSGKSTLIKLIDGLIDSTEGSIFIDQLKLNNENLFLIRKMIGIVFQNPDNQFVGSTVEDDIAFGMENRQYSPLKMKEIINNVLPMVGMENNNKRSPYELSGGQKQRVALAGIIALKPKILILDEATSMLDPLSRQKIMNLVKKLKQKYHMTIISVTHDSKELSYADRILIMNNGKIIKEKPVSEILSNIDEIRRLGLSIPFSERLRQDLITSGINNVPDQYLKNEEFINWIMKLVSKK